MNTIKEIQRLNEDELQKLTPPSASWHADYASSAWIYAGDLSYDLTEGDIITVFSQFGEVADINLARDKETGKSRGFAFLKYEDQQSTVLAVDNLAGMKLLDRIVSVDHVKNYRPPNKNQEEDEEENARIEQEVKEEEEGYLRDRIRVKKEEEESIRVKEGHDKSISPRIKQEDEDERAIDLDPEDPMREYIQQRRQEAEKRNRHKHRHRHRVESKVATPHRSRSRSRSQSPPSRHRHRSS